MKYATKIFTVDAMFNNPSTQKAAQALLELGREKYRPTGACAVYDRLTLRAMWADDSKAFNEVLAEVIRIYPDYLAKFLWNLENIPCVFAHETDQVWEDEEDSSYGSTSWYEQQEVEFLWNFLLDEFVDDDGLARVPDLGYMVALSKGQSFQDHSNLVGQDYSGSQVLLFERCAGGWKELGAGWLPVPASVNASAHYYCMVVPVIGFTPQWDKWSFAPSFAGSTVIKYKDLLSNPSRYEGMAEEPPIRAAVASRMKQLRYEGRAA